jgi:bacillithiol biosynthesis cysteine-adding enzyme BshC
MDAKLSAQFEKQIALKKQSYPAAQRALLAQVLLEKYKNLLVSEKVKANLELLQDSNTFSVTTGHQLCLMTGPLYFIYKILHVIKLSEELKAQFPQENFVPVYWMASEDHDFEEIKSFLLFGQKWSWESAQKGAVGRFDNSELLPLLAELKTKFQNNPEAEIHRLLHCFEAKAYGAGFFEFVHSLFDAYGLLIIDADEPALKQSAWPIWEKDLQTTAIHEAVCKETEKLKKENQATPIESKESNLFLLGKEKRERIEKSGALDFQKEDSEQLSPNVVLRPLYQEWILPNLAYVGGPSEIAYWQQLPLAFACLDLPFPLTIQRAGGILIQEKDLEFIEKIGFQKQDFLADKADLKARYLQAQGDQVPDYSIQQQLWSGYKNSFFELTEQELPQEKRMVEAELTRLQKQLEALEQKFEKTRKAKFDKALKQIDQLSEKLLPKGQLQERQLNILQFCPDGELSPRIAAIYEQMQLDSKESQWFLLP